MGVSRVHVKDALVAQVAERFPWSLQQAERDHDLQVGSQPRPLPGMDGAIVSGRTLIEDDPNRTPPYLTVGVARTSDQPEAGTDGWDYTWRVAVAAVVEAVDYEDTVDLAGLYAYALSECVLADPSISGLSTGAIPVAEYYDTLDSTKARTLAAVECHFDLPVRRARSLRDLPGAPPPEDDPAYQPAEVLTTSADAAPSLAARRAQTTQPVGA